jgi:hypothetical protein
MSLLNKPRSLSARERISAKYVIDAGIGFLAEGEGWWS